MPASTISTASPRRTWRLLGPLLLAGLALGLAIFHYFTGVDYTLPLTAVTHLKALPVTLDTVRVGVAALPVQANAYLLSQTHDVTGPFVRPDAAIALLILLVAGLTYFLAAVSTLTRAPFVVGMALVIFLLMSLNIDSLGVFDAQQRYFLILALLALGLPAYAFQAFWPHVPFWQRLLTFAGLLAGLSALVLLRSPYSPTITVLQIASAATLSGTVAVALVVLWVAYENIHGLLWLNTQAERPQSRFGLFPLLLSSGLYLALLFLYYWNQGVVQILPTVRLDPLVLLLPAVVLGWLGLRRRAASYGGWVSYSAAAPIYLSVLAVAAGALGYALATDNTPLLDAARDFTALAFLGTGAAFLLYLLLNFAPLIKQRLRVYRVVYEPRRLPFYVVYLIGLGVVVIIETRTQFFTFDQVQAGYYNHLGDLTRLQSEEQPTVDAIALLAERYYAESDVLDRYNHKAGWGRAALYRFRLQRQNEINALRRALSRAPSARLSLRLAALYDQPADFFDRQAVLREALRTAPTNAALAGDMAQLYARSTLTDSVDYYLRRAEATAPADEAVRTNRLAFLVQQQDWSAARQWTAAHSATAGEPALQSNELLLARLSRQPTPAIDLPAAESDLSLPTFARLYHATLARAPARDTSLLPTLRYRTHNPADSAYQEQLIFLLALTQHYAGHPAAAQASLLPLTIGTNAGAAYYQHLLGLWQLEQRLYTAATFQLRAATEHGYPTATIGLAYALALNNQPDSARTTLTDATSYAAQQLRQALAPRFAVDDSTVGDSLRTQLLVVRGGTLLPEQQLPAATAIPTPALRTVALLAQLPRALQAGQLAEVKQVLTRFAPPAEQPVASAWNVVRGNMYLAENNWPALTTLTRRGYFAALDQPALLTYRALLAARTQPATAEPQFVRLLHEAPFAEQAVLAAATYYTQRGKHQQAYDALVRGLEYAPASTGLLRAYALATLPLGLASYAEEPVAQLRTLLSADEYATFLAQYQAQRNALLTQANSWN